MRLRPNLTWILLPILPFAASAGNFVDESANVARIGQGSVDGALLLEPRHDLLDSLGLRLHGGNGDSLHLELRTSEPLRIAFGDGAPTAIRAGVLAVPALQFTRRSDGGRSPPLSLRAADRALGFDIVDPAGGVWLRIGHAMRSPDPADGLRLVSADLRIGPALAAWSDTDSEHLLLARIELQVPLQPPPIDAALAKSCALPDWPTAGFPVDVELTAISRVTSLRCRVLDSGSGCSSNAYTCDGPGGLEGEVIFVPDAWLRNSSAPGSADVPWYRKFSGDFPPYGNDQHPYLVWNLYRLDADGAITQIARSGLKHAFATANLGCADGTCIANGHVLGRGCSDLYDAGSNDAFNALAPRSEVIPATGQWGRCGSVFDDVLNDGSGSPGCDGIADSPTAEDCYRYRMVARESDIDPAQHPGARWFIDAWYVVRDDIDIFNSMGFRELAPHWLAVSPARWDAGALGAFRQGTVVDAWLEQAGAAEWTQRSLLGTAEGEALIAARVRRDGANYRYDYVVANFDLSRAETEGSEPDLRITSNLGLAAFVVHGAHGATATASAFRDGDGGVENDWLSASAASATSWEAPEATAHLAWGHLTSFTLHSPHPPGTGTAQLTVASGDPAALDVATLVPDASKVFGDRFE